MYTHEKVHLRVGTGGEESDDGKTDSCTQTYAQELDTSEKKREESRECT